MQRCLQPQVTIFAEEINGVYHLEVYLEDPDSSDYLFSFMTTGIGAYDLWSGTSMGLSNSLDKDCHRFVTGLSCSHRSWVWLDLFFT